MRDSVADQPRSQLVAFEPAANRQSFGKTCACASCNLRLVRSHGMRALRKTAKGVARCQSSERKRFVLKSGGT